MTKKHTSSVLIAALLVSAAPAFAQETINVGVCNSWPPYAMAILADQNDLAGEFELEFTNFNDPLGGHAALAAGQVDVLECSAEYAPLAVSRGTGVRIVSFTTPSYGVDHIVLAPGESVDALEGKTVAVPEAFIGHLMMGVWLQSVGVPLSSVEFVNMLPDEAVGPMIAGQIDAAYIYEPWVGQLVEELEGAQSVATSDEPEFLETGIFMDVIYMNPDFISDRRPAALGFLEARWASAGWWHENTSAANAALADYLGWGSADIDGIMGTDGKALQGGVYTYDFDQAAQVCGVLEGAPPLGLPNGAMVDVVADINRLWIELGLMDDTIDAAEGVDCSLMAELAKGGFRQSFSARAD